MAQPAADFLTFLLAGFLFIYIYKEINGEADKSLYDNKYEVV